MKAVLRLNLLVSAVFLLAMLLSLFGLVRQGERDIEREIGASISFVEQMIAAAQADVSRLQPLLNGNSRHIRFYLNQLPQNSVETEVPQWFVELLYPDGAITERPWSYPLKDGQVLYVLAAPEDEIDEVWESALALMMLFLMGALLSNLAIAWGVWQGLKPIVQLLKSVEQDRAGHDEVPTYPLPEANRLARHFDRMAQALEQEQQSNNQLTRQLMELQEQERTRLAHTLHDDLGQYLTGIRAQAFIISQTANRPEVVEVTAQRIIDHCDDMQNSFRSLIRDLHPVILDQLGLREALSNLAEQWQANSGIHCRVELPKSLPELGREKTSHLYRLIQEALHNVARHSAASEVHLSLQQGDDVLYLQVADDGCGLNADSKPGIGMRSMHQRARYLNSRLQLDSASSGGTRIYLQIPLETT